MLRPKKNRLNDVHASSSSSSSWSSSLLPSISTTTNSSNNHQRQSKLSFLPRQISSSSTTTTTSHNKVIKLKPIVTFFTFGFLTYYSFILALSIQYDHNIAFGNNDNHIMIESLIMETKKEMDTNNNMMEKKASSSSSSSSFTHKSTDELKSTRMDITHQFRKSVEEYHNNLYSKQKLINTTSTTETRRMRENHLIPLSYFQIGKLPSNITIQAIEILYKVQPLPKEYVQEILLHSREYLQSLPSVVTVNLTTTTATTIMNSTTSSSSSTINIVGDTHGQFFGVIHIFQTFGFPTPSSPYIFNGDIFDKGNYSFQIFLSLLMIQLSCPQCIYFTRGNHEVELSIPGSKGKMKEYVVSLYGMEIYDLLVQTIHELPIAILISGMSSSSSSFKDVHILENDATTKQKNQTQQTYGRGLVLHAGIISPDMTLSDISNINRGQNPPRNSFFEHLLWADPQNESGLDPNGHRGYIFGPDITQSFLDVNQLDFIIRSHSYKSNGYEVQHNNRVITVYSAPINKDDKGAIVKVNADMELLFETFKSAPYPLIEDWSKFSIF